MSSFDITDWTDYVRGLAAPEIENRMHAELTQDPEARRTVEALQRVVEVATADQEAELPKSVVDRVYELAHTPAKSAFEGLFAGLEKIAMALTFDSALVPAPAGVRDMQSAHRQLFYELDDVAVELRHEPHTGGGVVVGQMMNVGIEPAPLADVPVLALAHGHVVARTATGPLGEFQAAELPTKDLNLLFILDDRCLEVSLPTSDR